MHTYRTTADGPVGDAVLLLDPHRVPSGDGPPDPRAVAGWWPLGADGAPGPFRANRGYEPVDPGLPGDPLDALLRLAVDGVPDLEQLHLLLRGVLLELATDGEGRPVVARAPDGAPCVVVATSEQHRCRVAASRWRRVDLGQLAVALDEGVDVLVNPGGPASARLGAGIVREALQPGEEALVAAARRFGGTSSLDVIGWPRGER